MALVNLQLKEGLDKNKKPYYMVNIIAQRFTSEPIFISGLEYDYLVDLLKDAPVEE